MKNTRQPKIDMGRDCTGEHVHNRISEDQSAQAVLAVLAAHFVTADPAPYSGGRHYLDVDTRSTPALSDSDGQGGER